jgi:hypothetical protein
MEERLPETIETQPELLTHHYSEAGLVEQALPHWQDAGKRAVQRSANVEAISHPREDWPYHLGRFRCGLQDISTLAD